MRYGGLWGLIVLIADVWAIVNILQSGKSTGDKVIWTVVVLVLPLLAQPLYTSVFINEVMPGKQPEWLRPLLWLMAGTIDRRRTAVEARRPVMEAYARWLQDKGADVIAFPARA